jgi:type IV secretory pathway VirB10-like protein
VRKAINENPTMQIAVLAVFGVLFAVLFYTMVLSGGDEGNPDAIPIAGGQADPATNPEAAAAATPEPVAPAPEPAADAAPAAPAAPVPEPTAPVTPASPPAPGGAALTPTRGLPSDVLVPLAKGKAVAMLVVDPKAISDREVRVYTRRLSGRRDVAVMTVDVNKIADYSRITQGVNVSRTPALVVVSPRRGSDQLTGSVHHGFRGAKGIEVALEDALYEGGRRSASP